ncbi:hypothetical protein YC2023_027946 [Brassica napus]
MRRKYMLRLVPTNDNNAGKTHPSTCLFKQDIAPWLFKNLVTAVCVYQGIIIVYSSWFYFLHAVLKSPLILLAIPISK